jgi:8-oxo-dGTP pyrophosphatase MutT (NUDIX family)
MKPIERRIILETYPFNVEQLHLEKNGVPYSDPYYRLVSKDWVNVLPITDDGRAVLIRQPRVGVLRTILETPGGIIESGENDPTLTAARELEEETGFTSQRFLSLGSLNTNPAILTNRCHFFLAMGCRLATQRQHFPDADEDIEVELFDVGALDSMVRTAQIDHSLSALCILLAGKYLNLPLRP